MVRQRQHTTRYNVLHDKARNDCNSACRVTSSSIRHSEVLAPTKSSGKGMALAGSTAVSSLASSSLVGLASRLAPSLVWSPLVAWSWIRSAVPSFIIACDCEHMRVRTCGRCLFIAHICRQRCPGTEHTWRASEAERGENQLLFFQPRSFPLNRHNRRTDNCTRTRRVRADVDPHKTAKYSHPSTDSRCLW